MFKTMLKEVQPHVLMEVGNHKISYLFLPNISFLGSYFSTYWKNADKTSSQFFLKNKMEI